MKYTTDQCLASATKSMREFKKAIIKGRPDEHLVLCAGASRIWMARATYAEFHGGEIDSSEFERCESWYGDIGSNTSTPTHMIADPSAYSKVRPYRHTPTG